MTADVGRYPETPQILQPLVLAFLMSNITDSAIFVMVRLLLSYALLWLFEVIGQ